MKPIRLSKHANDYITSRGFTVAEVEQAIRSAKWTAAEQNRLECRMTLPYNEEWHGKRFASKQVRPVFAELDDEIVVITVYTYYF